MSDDNQIDLNSPEIQALIDAKAEEIAQGLKAKNSELLGKLTKKNSEFDGLKSQFSDVNLEEYRAFKAQQQKIADQELIAKGDIDSIINQRVQEMQKDYEEQLSKARSDAQKSRESVLNSEVLKAAAQAGIDSSMLGLVSLQAKQDGVSLSDEFKPVLTDKDGNIRYGKDGVTPLSLGEYFESLREKVPLLWGVAQGAGAKSNVGGGGQKKAEDYTEAEKIQLFESNREEYNRLFKPK